MNSTAYGSTGAPWGRGTATGTSPFVEVRDERRAELLRTSPLAFRALLGFTFVMLIAPQSFLPPLALLRPAFLLAGVAMFTYAMGRWTARLPIFVGGREVWLGMALLWWAILTVPLGLWPGGSFGLLKDLYVKSLLLFWLLAHIVTTPARLSAVAWCLSVLAVPLALTGAKSFVTGQFVRDAGRIGGYEAALTGNPNDLALMLNLILPLTIALLLSTRRSGHRLVLAGIVLVEMLGVVVTFSRSGFLTLALIGVCALWRLVRRGFGAQAALVLVVAMMSVPLLPGGYLDRLSTITNPEADTTGSAQARWSDMQDAVQWVVEHPVIGAGLGNNVLALNEIRGPSWTAVHDVYLQYAVDLGLPGLALFCALLAGSIRRAGAAAAAADARGREELAAIADGVKVSLMAFAAAAIFYPAGYHFYFFYMAGLAVAAGRIAEVVAAPVLEEAR